MKTDLSKSAAWTISCFTLVLLLFSNPLQAQFVWDGGDGSSQDWSTDANWEDDDAPVSATDTVLVFQGTNNTGTAGTPLNQNIAAPMDIDSLTFQQGTAQFFLGGGTLRLNPADPTTGILRQGTAGTGGNTNTTINNNIILAGDARFRIDDNGANRSLIFNGMVDLDDNTLTLMSTSGRFFIFENTVSGQGGITVPNNEAAALRFTTTNTFEGGITITGTLATAPILVEADEALGTGTITNITRNITLGFRAINTPEVTLSNTFVIGHASDNISFVARTLGWQGVLNLEGDFVLAGDYAGGRAFEMDGASTVVTINGVISEENDPRGFRVTTGAGTMVITNENNTYTGATVVGRTDVAGHTPTLIVNGNIASSSLVTVHQGATLRGTGVTPGITVGSGGILAPGLQNGVGILAAEGDVLMQDGSIFEILVGDLADQSSLLAIGGGIDLEENVTLSLWGNLDGAYTIATFHTMAMPYGTFSTVLLNGSSMEWEDSGYSIFYGSDSIQVIPEPGAASLFGVATALLLLFRRRFRQVPSDGFAGISQGGGCHPGGSSSRG